MKIKRVELSPLWLIGLSSRTAKASVETGPASSLSRGCSTLAEIQHLSTRAPLGERVLSPRKGKDEFGRKESESFLYSEIQKRRPEGYTYGAQRRIYSKLSPQVPHTA